MKKIQKAASLAAIYFSLFSLGIANAFDSSLPKISWSVPMGISKVSRDGKVESLPIFVASIEDGSERAKFKLASQYAKADNVNEIIRLALISIARKNPFLAERIIQLKGTESQWKFSEEGSEFILGEAEIAALSFLPKLNSGERYTRALYSQRDEADSAKYNLVLTKDVYKKMDAVGKASLTLFGYLYELSNHANTLRLQEFVARILSEKFEKTSPETVFDWSVKAFNLNLSADNSSVAILSQFATTSELPDTSNMECFTILEDQVLDAEKKTIDLAKIDESTGYPVRILGSFPQQNSYSEDWNNFIIGYTKLRSFVMSNPVNAIFNFARLQNTKVNIACFQEEKAQGAQEEGQLATRLRLLQIGYSYDLDLYKSEYAKAAERVLSVLEKTAKNDLNSQIAAIKNELEDIRRTLPQKIDSESAEFKDFVAKSRKHNTSLDVLITKRLGFNLDGYPGVEGVGRDEGVEVISKKTVDQNLFLNFQDGATPLVFLKAQSPILDSVNPTLNTTTP